MANALSTLALAWTAAARKSSSLLQGAGAGSSAWPFGRELRDLVDGPGGGELLEGDRHPRGAGPERTARRGRADPQRQSGLDPERALSTRHRLRDGGAG